MRKKYLLLYASLLFSSVVFSAGVTDSIVSRKSWYVFPVLSYQTETSVAPGLAYGYYFKSKDISRVSSVAGSATYTFLGQFAADLTPRIFFPLSKWYLFSNLKFRNYPDYFYGVGNRSAGLKQSYSDQSLTVLFQPQYRLSDHLLLGPAVSERYEKVQNTEGIMSYLSANGMHQYLTNPGWTPFNQLSVGFVAAYDSRDNQFYPQNGIFAKVSCLFSKAGWGSSYTLQHLSVDLRQYIPLFNSHVFVWQLYGNGVFGSNAVPFQLLPTLGGADLMRSFIQGMYRDNTLLVAQTEYRIPLYKRFKAAVFCSTGDVMGSDFTINKLKIAYGAGLRYRLNDARVHLRLDVAQNNYGDKMQVYFTASEAF